MSSSKRLLSGLLLAGLLAGCSPPAVEPELTLSASPRTIDGVGQKATLKIVGLDDKGKAGTGTVRVTSVAGSLKAGTEVTLLAGEGAADFACDRAADPACTGSIKLNAEWVVSGKLVAASTSVTVSPAVDAGIDAGFDAGVDAGVEDGGMSLTITSDKTQIIAGVGDPAILTATLLSDGQPVAAQTVTFTTSTGRLGPVAGSSVGMSYMAMTGANGQVQAQITAAATDMGQATVTVGAAGAMASTIINIVSVSQIGYVSTECPQTTMNCNLMGLQGSGFNETAQVKFKLTDGTAGGVSGIRVDFTLINAPAGTSVDPTAMTNSMGEVRANVRAGTTVGTFSVRASTINGMFSVTSPTIGVRGAKASNRGFTLRCDKINLAAYIAVTPPLPLMVNCTVGLTDRYGNPVGTGTQVRLNSEAGTVPNNVATAPFSPTGGDEGLGNFAFSTLGNFPALDVPPLAADSTQYPYALAAEPSSVVGPLTRNPRDGLVTIIAYLQGEEDFKDDNSNGVRDPTEQFIDQGEPFVDRNDNNVWDTGESFIDTPPADGGISNGLWDGPNGSWDSNAQIWTEYRLIYTGTSSALSVLTMGMTRSAAGGGTYGNLTPNQVKYLSIYVPDQNLNRLESGAGINARFSPSTAGTVGLVNINTGLDGYGFGFERRLVNAAGTGPCSTSELVCRWKILMGTWSEGYAGEVELTGAAMASMPPMSVSQSLIVDTTVRGVTSAVSATGSVVY